MKKNYSLILALLVLSLNFQCSAQKATSSLKKLVIIRHGEKPDKGDNLSCQGLNRALQLPAVLHRKFGNPDYVYVPAVKTGSSTSTARMYQTIVPFAVQYNLTIDTKFDVDNTDGLVKSLLKKSGTVLIVWEHKHIDNILKSLGMSNVPKWEDGDFDSIWIVDFSSGKPVLTKDREGISPAADCK